MALVTNVALFWTAVWADFISGSAPIDARDTCKSDSDVNKWFDFSIEIPDEALPDNALTGKAKCSHDRLGKGIFERCTVTINNAEMEFPASEKSFSFLGKSGKRHAFSCPANAATSVGLPFATEICSKQSEMTARCVVGNKGPGKMKVEFKCNDDKSKIVSCKAEGQGDWSDVDKPIAFWGGKSGKLNSIECQSFDPPKIVVSYARDICNAEQKDQIEVEDGSKPVTVFFECNKQKDAILRCFPNRKLFANGVTAGGPIVRFDKVPQIRFKEIQCWRYAKPKIEKVVLNSVDHWYDALLGNDEKD